MSALRALVARVLHVAIRKLPPAPLSLDELRERAFAEIDTKFDRTFTEIDSEFNKLQADIERHYDFQTN
jgi:hypothetical protein